MSIVLKGNDGTKIVFDGEWLEKLPVRDGGHREHISDFREVKVKHKPAKRRKPGRYEVLIACRGFLSLTCDEDQKPVIDELQAALEAKKDSA